MDVSDIKVTEQGIMPYANEANTLSLANLLFANLLTSTIDGYLNAKADLVDSDFLVKQIAPHMDKLQLFSDDLLESLEPLADDECEHSIKFIFNLY